MGSSKKPSTSKAALSFVAAYRISSSRRSFNTLPRRQSVCARAHQHWRGCLLPAAFLPAINTRIYRLPDRRIDTWENGAKRSSSETELSAGHLAVSALRWPADLAHQPAGLFLPCDGPAQHNCLEMSTTRSHASIILRS